ncbi:MAG: malonyl-CoA decarboxylase, partial [Pseudomonadota bacterium]|nr:malonyl-CoA decarboxylase [Pseudomonadota bacterium]
MAYTDQQSGFFDRTMENLRRAWTGLSGQTWQRRGGDLREDLPEDEVDLVRGQMRECLEARGGEVSARNRAAELGRSYLALNDTGRTRFLELMANEFGTDQEAVDVAVAALQNADPAERHTTELALGAALE